MAEDPRPIDYRAGTWVMYDLSMRSIDRLDAFNRLRRLGYDRRQAAEEIQSYEREPRD